MPNPKHKHSKARRDRRRTGDALTRPPLSRCSNCQDMKAPHRVCPHCGYYAGREIITTKEQA
jgi:large subunit ribosomal protein L32